MLGRQDDLGDAGRFAVLIFDGHLAFGVRPKLGGFARAGLSLKGKLFENFVRVVNWRRHERRSFTASVAEHNSLIARSLVLIASSVDALRDVGGLGMEQHLDLRVSPVETVLLVADILDRATRRGLDRVLANRGAAHFTRDDDAVGSRQGLTGNTGLIGIHTGFRAFTKEKVHDFVGNPVAYLVRMAFRDGFTRKQVVFSSQGLSPLDNNVPSKLLVSSSVCQAILAVMFVKSNAVNSLSQFFAGVRRSIGHPLGFFVVSSERGDKIHNPLADFWVVDPREGQVQMQTFGGR